MPHVIREFRSRHFAPHPVVIGTTALRRLTACPSGRDERVNPFVRGPMATRLTRISADIALQYPHPNGTGSSSSSADCTLALTGTLDQYFEGTVRYRTNGEKSSRVSAASIASLSFVVRRERHVCFTDVRCERHVRYTSAATRATRPYRSECINAYNSPATTSPAIQRAKLVSRPNKPCAQNNVSNPRNRLSMFRCLLWLVQSSETPMAVSPSAPYHSRLITSNCMSHHAALIEH